MSARATSAKRPQSGASTNSRPFTAVSTPRNSRLGSAGGTRGGGGAAPAAATLKVALDQSQTELNALQVTACGLQTRTVVVLVALRQLRTLRPAEQKRGVGKQSAGELIRRYIRELPALAFARTVPADELSSICQNATLLEVEADAGVYEESSAMDHNLHVVLGGSVSVRSVALGTTTFFSQGDCLDYADVMSHASERSATATAYHDGAKLLVLHRRFLDAAIAAAAEQALRAREECIRSCPLFADSPGVLVSQLAACVKAERYGRGSTIATAGSEAMSLWFIRGDGEVSVSRTEGGSVGTVMVSALGGGFFGQESLFRGQDPRAPPKLHRATSAGRTKVYISDSDHVGQLYRAKATALTTVELFSLNRLDYEAVTEVAERFSATIAERAKRSTELRARQLRRRIMTSEKVWGGSSGSIGISRSASALNLKPLSVAGRPNPRAFAGGRREGETGAGGAGQEGGSRYRHAGAGHKHGSRTGGFRGLDSNGIALRPRAPRSIINPQKLAFHQAPKTRPTQRPASAGPPRPRSAPGPALRDAKMAHRVMPAFVAIRPKSAPSQRNPRTRWAHVDRKPWEERASITDQPGGVAGEVLTPEQRMQQQIMLANAQLWPSQSFNKKALIAEMPEVQGRADQPRADEFKAKEEGI